MKGRYLQAPQQATASGVGSSAAGTVGFALSSANRRHRVSTDGGSPESSAIAAMKASTHAASKWRSRSASITLTASSKGIAFLYGRTVVNASNTSATATIRAASGIASPARPFG